MTENVGHRGGQTGAQLMDPERFSRPSPIAFVCYVAAAAIAIVAIQGSGQSLERLAKDLPGIS